MTKADMEIGDIILGNIISELEWNLSEISLDCTLPEREKIILKLALSIYEKKLEEVEAKSLQETALQIASAEQLEVQRIKMREILFNQEEIREDIEFTSNILKDLNVTHTGE